VTWSSRLLVSAVALACAIAPALAAGAPRVAVAEHPLFADAHWVRSVDAEAEVLGAPAEDARSRTPVPGTETAAELQQTMLVDGEWWARVRYQDGVRGFLPARELRPVGDPVPLPEPVTRELEILAGRSGRTSAIVVRDAYGRTLFSAGSTRPLVLASVTKVFTVAAGFEFVPGTFDAGRILRPSDNYRAQLVMNRLGRGSNTRGTALARRYAADLGARVRLADGSGLSPANRASATEVADMLQALRERPYFEGFRRGLPLIGRSGTLRYRLRGTAAQGRVRAKTGTLFTPSVKTLAGYVTPRGGAQTTNRVLVFATLHNGIDRTRAVAIQDRVAFLLATRGASGTPAVVADPPPETETAG
jgi:hypothetical protein